MVIKGTRQREYFGMMDQLDLDLKLLRGPESRLTTKEETAIKAFFADPTEESWVSAANVVVQVLTSVDDPRPLSLGMAVVRHVPAVAGTYRRARREGGHEEVVWDEIPPLDAVHSALSTITRTDRLPSIALELDLARTATTRLTYDERIAICRAYYGGLVTDFDKAKDIVLLTEDDADGADLTVLKAIDETDPGWLPRNILTKMQNGRQVKTLSCAPPPELFRAALIRATH